MHQEFAQAYRLGALEGDYALNTRKILVSLVSLVAFAVVIPVVLFWAPHAATSPITIIVPFLIFFLVVGSIGLLVFYFSYQQLHVYVYTYGLVYLNGNRHRVVFWQQMTRVFTNRGYLFISVNKESGIAIPSYISRFGELRARIQQAIATSSYLD